MWRDIRRRWRQFRYRSVVIVLGVFVLLGWSGAIGSGEQRFQPERFESKFVVVEPAGGNAIRITETVDIDFAGHDRHGYQRFIPNDFGVPTEVVASSTANSELQVTERFSDTHIRIGSPDETFSGQQRYVVSYTLPDAQLDSGDLFLDIIGNSETLGTDRFEVVVNGFEFAETSCSVGRYSYSGGCDLEAVGDGTYRAVIEPLEPGDGITIGGEDLAVVDRVEVDVPAPPIDVAGNNRWVVAGVLLAAGVVSAFVIYQIVSWVGAGRVAHGGATEAAFVDDLYSDEVLALLDGKRVPDYRLEDLAPVEFAPPSGLRPWQGALVLNEVVDHRTVGAWTAEMVASDAIRVVGVRLERGDAFADPEGYDRLWLDELLTSSAQIMPGSTDREVQAAWNRIAADQARLGAESGWWDGSPPTVDEVSVWKPNWSVISFVGFCLLGLALVVNVHLLPMVYWLLWVWSILTASLPVMAIAAAVAVGFATLQCLAYLIPRRTVVGSAVALRTHAFRKFLSGSEGSHVDAAWDRSRIREYSAWAVALGEAEAWTKAIGRSGPAEIAANQTSDGLLDGFERILARIADGRHDYQVSLRSRDSADPWRSLGDMFKRASENAGGGGGSPFGSFSSSGGSSSVGGGGGGGSSGSW